MTQEVSYELCPNTGMMEEPLRAVLSSSGQGIHSSPRDHEKLLKKKKVSMISGLSQLPDLDR
jgi:hypothetical protein